MAAFSACSPKAVRRLTAQSRQVESGNQDQNCRTAFTYKNGCCKFAAKSSVTFEKAPKKICAIDRCVTISTILEWCPRTGSNRRPSVYKFGVPEMGKLISKGENRQGQGPWVGTEELAEGVGFEPAEDLRLPWFQDHCLTMPPNARQCRTGVVPADCVLGQVAAGFGNVLIFFKEFGGRCRD